MTLRELINIIGYEIDDAAMKRVEAKTQDMFKRMQSFGKEMSMKVTAPILGAATLAVNSFTNYNEALAEVRQTLEATGITTGKTVEQFDQMSETLSKGTLYGHSEILSSVTGNLLMFGNISGKVFDRAQQDAIDLAARMKVDLTTATNLLGRALENPAENLNVLTRTAKLKFTPEEKNMIEVMVKAGRTAEAQGYILERLEKHGIKGAAKAVADASSGFLMFKKELTDLGEKFGKILFPYFKKFYEILIKVIDHLKNLSPETKKFLMVLAGAAAIIGPVIGLLGTLGMLLPKIKLGFEAIKLAMSGPQLITAIASLGELALAVASLAIVFLALQDVLVFFKGGKSITGEIIEDIGFWIDKLRESFPGFINDIGFKLGKAIDDLIDRFKLWFGWIKTIGEWWVWLADTIANGLTKITGIHGLPVSETAPPSQSKPKSYSEWQSEHGITPNNVKSKSGNSNPSIQNNIHVTVAVPPGNTVQQNNAVEGFTKQLFDLHLNRTLRNTYNQFATQQ